MFRRIRIFFIHLWSLCQSWLFWVAWACAIFAVWGVANAAEPNRDQMVQTGLTIIGTVIALGYLLPSIIALMRRHPSRGAILILNMFFGWTFVGWVASLVWACSAKQQNIRISWDDLPPGRHYDWH